uniref:KRAB-related domain-containing protein n=1 Tax=Gorilla gorilla gorilla TaxID=9595 RepID=A0A2I2Y1Z0_GORGO
MNGDDAFARRPRAGAQIPEKIQKVFDDIAKYFSKKECFNVTLSPFMRNKRAADFQGNDSDNDRNHGNQVEHPQMTFGRLHRIFPKIMPEKPAEEGNDSKEVLEASGPQNDGKQLSSSSEKIHERSGKHAWIHRLRERKQLVIYEEISDPEEDDE